MYTCVRDHRQAIPCNGYTASPMGTKTETPISIIIADHEVIFRVGAVSTLSVEDDLRIVGQPRSAVQMLFALTHHRAHVLLVSNRFLPTLLEHHPLTQHPTSVVVVADDEDAAAAFVAMGAKGVVYRSIEGPSLVEAMRRVAGGETFIHSPGFAMTEHHQDIASAHVVNQLSDFELRIVGDVFRGCANREIAENAGTTEQAIKNGIRSIFDKTGVSDRLELALYVFHHRMLQRAARAVNIGDGLPVDNQNSKYFGPKHFDASLLDR
jgi:DNA-binding NarL/FixJ family response regulator